MIFDFQPVVTFFDICSNGVEQLYFCVDQFFRAIAIRAVEHLPKIGMGKFTFQIEKYYQSTKRVRFCEIQR
jgi:hypothetical protein